jgi:hypothetical protein
MASAYQELQRIVDVSTPPAVKIVAMRGFAEELKWTPSYEFQASFGVEAAGDHLVVEHGLDNSAIISFLKVPYRACDLTASQLRSLLAISYNNLVEWHLFVSQTDIRQINNLAESSNEPNADRIFPLTPHEFTKRLSAFELDRLQGVEGFRKTLRACDDALIQVLTRWKRMLKADYPAADTVNLSALFNAFIFVRGCEDRNLNRAHRNDRVLVSVVNDNDGSEIDLTRVLTQALSRTGVGKLLSDYIDVNRLVPFSAVDKATALNLSRDFYAPLEASYDFDFALMSKHALSRIYERYVTLLGPSADNNADQLYFINPTPVEQAPNRTGSVYTPQFIAGFFSRFIWQNTTPRRFRALRTIDPACGSGIFLRTILELQCNPMIPGTTPGTINEAFERTEGIDSDPNAIEATRLSLALLHLAATGELPEKLQIRSGDAILEALENRIIPQTYGAIISNPPYVKYDHLSDAIRGLYRTFLGPEYMGRLDAYIPFVKLCLESVERDGFVCMVLPQAFLNARNAAPLRQLISNGFDVRCLVDLSSVKVFEHVSAYNILLIVQRRESIIATTAIAAQVAQVTEFVGAALQACLDGRSVDTPYYRVFTVGQSFFRNQDWMLVSPSHLAADERLRSLPRLSEYLTVSQGFVTGADEIFILPKAAVPKGEDRIYLNYLPDREIGRYRIPATADQVVFYPYDGLRALGEEEVSVRFPKTWQYLQQNRSKLEARGPVRSGKTPWWRPERPRDPESMLRPKIVCPHLMLTPRFALDSIGHFAVSRSPFSIARDSNEEATLLKFFSAVLNSSVSSWYLKTYAPKYAHGYNRVEANLLKSIPVPDISRVDAGELHRITSAVDRFTSGRASRSLDAEIDELVAELYGFTSLERKNILGFE